MSIKSLLERNCCLCFFRKLFGLVKAEQQIKLADVNYLQVYCAVVQKEPVMVWTGFPYWDLSLFEIHLGQSFLLSFLQKKADLFIVIIPDLFLAYEVLKISKLYIIPLGKI